MASTPLLSVQHVCQRFGELRAVDGVLFEVTPGEILERNPGRVHAHLNGRLAARSGVLRSRAPLQPLPWRDPCPVFTKS